MLLLANLCKSVSLVRNSVLKRNSIYMIGQRSLEACNAELFQYDVVDRGWEQEQNGYTADDESTPTHLGKDFTDAELAEIAIAPDNLKYALRLNRWGGITVRQTMASFTDAEMVLVRTQRTSMGHSAAFHAHRAAMDLVAEVLRNAIHKKDEEYARQNRFNTTMRASRLLIYAASAQADEFGFDLTEAFSKRLVYLRDRFGMPQPKR